MSKQPIIVIGRQFGSGGHEIGRLLAEKLGYPLYDKEILAQAAKSSGLAEELLKEIDEKPNKSFLYSLSVGLGVPASYHLYGSDDTSIATGDKVFTWQSKAIRELAEKGPGIFVGRCADYILKDHPDLISVFIYAPTEARVKRIREVRVLVEQPAREMIAKTDKSRANYYNYYTDRAWGEPENYDLCIDSSKLGLEGTAELLAAYVAQRTK